MSHDLSPQSAEDTGAAQHAASGAKDNRGRDARLHFTISPVPSTSEILTSGATGGKNHNVTLPTLRLDFLLVRYLLPMETQPIVKWSPFSLEN